MSLRDKLRSRRLSGVAVPLWSLRLEDDCGTGEFRHLVPFADWCQKSGLRVIQLLPIHDSGTNTSPYSAVSAFALNPLYLDLSDLPNSTAISEDLEALRRRYADRPRLAYSEIRDEKLSLAGTIFASLFGEGASAEAGSEGQSQTGTDGAVGDQSADLDAWIASHDWIKPYAAYVVLKERHEMRPWWEWGADSEPSSTLIDRIWKDEASDTCRFLAWLQYQLQRQLDEVVSELGEREIFLKGDVPILMSRDSADVWWERRVFDLSYQAGAPPDMFSADGQNWGFPVYNWELLKKEEYSWWRNRLDQAERWFDAIRIDHVLGFFRIWAIPEGDISGRRGHYRPARYLYLQEFLDAGISADRVTWLAEPHISGADLRELLGDSFATIADALLFKLPDEELYLFRPDIEGERAIVRITEEGNVRDRLIEWFRDRALIAVGDDRFAPAWFAEKCSRLAALSDQERDALLGLFDMAQGESDSIWHDAGLERLAKLAAGKDFLACAEDLGAVPPVVPVVLKQLEIVGLRIPRWTRRWEEAGQPFVEPDNYEPLTVCTPSVHDTSTLRGWWEEENDRAAFWGTFGLEYAMPDSLGSADVEAVLTEIYRRVASVLCISQLQDYLAMDPDIAPASVDEERINWPGTTSERNWVYRMPISIEALSKNQELTKAVERVNASRV